MALGMMPSFWQLFSEGADFKWKVDARLDLFRFLKVLVRCCVVLQERFGPEHLLASFAAVCLGLCVGILVSDKLVVGRQG